MQAIRMISIPERKYLRGGTSSLTSTELPSLVRARTLSSDVRLESLFSDMLSPACRTIKHSVSLHWVWLVIKIVYLSLGGVISIVRLMIDKTVVYIASQGVQKWFGHFKMSESHCIRYEIKCYCKILTNASGSFLRTGKVVVV